MTEDGAVNLLQSIHQIIHPFPNNSKNVAIQNNERLFTEIQIQILITSGKKDNFIKARILLTYLRGCVIQKLCANKDKTIK